MDFTETIITLAHMDIPGAAVLSEWLEDRCYERGYHTFAYNKVVEDLNLRQKRAFVNRTLRFSTRLEILKYYRQYGRLPRATRFGTSTLGNLRQRLQDVKTVLGI